MDFLIIFLLALLGIHQAHASLDLLNPSLSSSIYEPCLDHSAFCFGFPDSCVTEANCQVLFRSEFSIKSGFQLHLIAPSITADKYIAVGFTNTSSMSGLVVECYHSSQPAQSTIEYSFNQYNHHHNEPIANRTEVTGFTNLNASYQNGQLECDWQIEPQEKVKYDDDVFDFGADKYYVQLATGPYDPKTNKIKYHDKGKLSSKSAMSLKLPNF